MSGERPAARLSDEHTCPLVTGWVPHVGGPILPACAITVRIGGLPAARVGDPAMCNGPPDVIAQGSATVRISGLPAARLGDMTAHGGVIVQGMPTVMIGDAAGDDRDDDQGQALEDAADLGLPFAEICGL